MSSTPSRSETFPSISSTPPQSNDERAKALHEQMRTEHPDRDVRIAIGDFGKDRVEIETHIRKEPSALVANVLMGAIAATAAAGAALMGYVLIDKVKSDRQEKFNDAVKKAAADLDAARRASGGK